MMFGYAYFGQSYFGSGFLDVTSPTLPGLEYKSRVDRLHYRSAEAHRQQSVEEDFKSTTDLLHYQSAKED